MEIIDNRKSVNTTFRDIKIGECFIDDEETVYLKVHGYDSQYNAVQLDYGALETFKDNEQVHSIKASITIY